MATMEDINKKCKLKDYEIELPDMYLGAGFNKMHSEFNKEFWVIFSGKYCDFVVKNVTELLNKKGLRLPSKCATPLANGYTLELDVIPELKSDGLKYYQ